MDEITSTLRTQMKSELPQKENVEIMATPQRELNAKYSSHKCLDLNHFTATKTDITTFTPKTPAKSVQPRQA